MPIDPNAVVRISAFNRVPDFARGQVRGPRVRWALEEAAIPYRVRKLDARSERPADYFDEQPFGQVPAYRDGELYAVRRAADVLGRIPAAARHRQGLSVRDREPAHPPE